MDAGAPLDAAGVLGALRDALAGEIRAGGRYVPHVDVPPPLAPTHAFDVPGDVAEETPAHPAPIEPVGARLAVPIPPPDPVEASAPFDDPDDPSDSDAMPTFDLFGAPVPGASDSAQSPYDRIEALIPDDHPVKPAGTLAELEEIVRGRVFIDLDRNRIQPVFGVGDPHAGLMVIGEAPGADEDRQGEPFVGRAGQLLTKILSAIGFERDQVYITNILKSRPPGNRDPEPDEIEGHLPILLKQIVLIQPRVLLCVGKTSGNALLNRRSSLAGLRDKEHSFGGLPLFVTYHPAALLRNEQWKRPTWEDVKLMRTRYDALMQEGA